ncbi:MAG TPA: class I SAM-dependent methyltransferase [Bacteroidota bacterium]|nr:class I SAM-dependent methyltransferase [Bacteroidota bacterium]
MKTPRRKKTKSKTTADPVVPVAPLNGARSVLDLGCGMRKRPGAVGIDVNPRSSADIIHDLNTFPYPFPDSSFDEIYCDNVIEHLDDVVKVMEELHRIAKPAGEIVVIVPFFPHRQAHTDPTHRHYFGIHSFDYFVEGTAYSSFRYSETKFVLRSIEFDKGIIHTHLFDKFLVSFANRRKELYENRIANIFPLRHLTFQLDVVK